MMTGRGSVMNGRDFHDDKSRLYYERSRYIMNGPDILWKVEILLWTVHICYERSRFYHERSTYIMKGSNFIMKDRDIL